MAPINLLTPPIQDNRTMPSTTTGFIQAKKRESNIATSSRINNRAQSKGLASSMASFISSTVLYLLYGTSLDGMAHSNQDQFITFVQSILSCTENNVTEPVIMVSLLYVSRYVERVYSISPNQAHCSIIQPNSQIKIWITALMLADAFMNDSAYATKSWALVSHVPVKECVKMRRVFLEVLNYDLNIGIGEFRDWNSCVYVLQRKLDYVTAARKSQFVAQFQLHQSRPSMVITPPITSAATYQNTVSSVNPTPLLVSPTPCFFTGASIVYPDQARYAADQLLSHQVMQQTHVGRNCNFDNYYNSDIQQWASYSRYPTPPPHHLHGYYYEAIPPPSRSTSSLSWS